MSKRKRPAEKPSQSQEHLRKSRRKSKIVETVNSLSLDDFVAQYLTHDSHLRKLEEMCLDLKPPLEIIKSSPNSESTEFLDKCFKLIEESSADDYRHSEMRWSPVKKKQEMRLPDMRYIILYQTHSKANAQSTPRWTVQAFTSFMITYEDGHEVVYIYEIHLAKQYQGQGLGKMLMKVVESIGQHVKVEKSMLTVFNANEKAVRFYHSLGYVEDEDSPKAKHLRNGTVKRPSYTILSKPL